MIFISEAHCIMEGSGITLLAEITMLLKNLCSELISQAGISEKEADRCIDDCLTHSRMSDKERDDEIKKILKETIQKSIEWLDNYDAVDKDCETDEPEEAEE